MTATCFARFAVNAGASPENDLSDAPGVGDSPLQNDCRINDARASGLSRKPQAPALGTGRGDPLHY